MEGFKRPESSRNEKEPLPDVEEIALVAEGLEQKLQAEPALPGELKPEAAKDLRDTLHTMLDKQQDSHL